MPESNTVPPGAKPGSEPHVRPPMVIRGGFIVHRRGSDTGMLTTPPHNRVYEHGSLDSAVAEARRLAAKFKREFAVFQEVGSARPDPEIDAETPVAATPPIPATPEAPAPRPIVEHRAPRRRTQGGKP